MSSKTFDPYRDWLGIPDPQRPLNHYQLLRLNPFEDDTAQIRERFHKLSAHVRKQLAGKAAPQAQALLGELTKAMLCLTDARRKADYDLSLGRKTSIDVRNKSFDEILVARRIIDAAQLVKAKKLASATGLELHDALVQQKFAPQEAVTQARAESLGISYMDMADVQPEAELIAKLPAVFARQHSCVPLVVDRDQVAVAAVNPFADVVEEELRLRLGMPARLVLCTPAKLHEFINQHYPREAAVAQLSTASGAKPTAAANVATPMLSAAERAEKEKKRQQLTLIAGMFGFTAVVMVGNLLLNWEALTTYGLGALVGGVAAGVTWTLNR